MSPGVALAAGLLASTSALAQETIKVGAPFNVTGALSSLDAPALNGAKLKAKEINDAGGINGKQIELVVYDTKTDPTVIASTASQLVGQVPVAMGFTDSDSVLAAGPIFQQAGIPFVTPGATSPKLPDQIGDMIFLACFGDNVQAAAGADFVTKKLNGKTAYLLRDIGAEYTTLLAQYFDDAFTKDGGQIVLARRLQDRRQDFYRADHQAEGLVADAGRALRLGDAGRDRPDREADAAGRRHAADRRRRRLRHAAPDRRSAATRRTMSTSRRTPTWPRIPRRESRSSTRTIRPPTARRPENAFAALGYDTLGLIADAIKRAGSEDPKAIRDAIAATQGYAGVTGTIGFPPDVRVPAKSVAMIGAKDQKLFLADEVMPSYIPAP